MVTTRNVDYTAHLYCDSLLIQSTSVSFCGPASYHTDYGVETIMWELHTLFLTVYKAITGEMSRIANKGLVVPLISF